MPLLLLLLLMPLTLHALARPEHAEASRLPANASMQMWVRCRLAFVVVDRTSPVAAHLRASNASDDDDDTPATCRLEHGCHSLRLRSDDRTRRAVAQFGTSAFVAMSVAGAHCYRSADARLADAPPAGVHCVEYTILEAHLDSVSLNASSSVGTSLLTPAPTTHPHLADSGRYFDGVRSLRLRTIVITARDVHTGETLVPTYAGAGALERRAWATNQRRFMDAEYRHSSYGKLGFDDARSDTVEVDVGPFDSASVYSGYCHDWVWDATREAYLRLSVMRGASDFDAFDAVVYYLPYALSSRSRSCHGVAGLCGWPGALTDNNPTASAYAPNRASFAWRYSCATMDQRVSWSSIARANVMAHELGHYLGLHHAGGVGRRYGEPSATAEMVEYGDTSATMGNDHHELNSFTAPARYFLGVLADAAVVAPTSSPSPTAATVVVLRALTLAADGSDGVHSALVLACPHCRARNANFGGVVGGELWISFRGDETTCAPEHQVPDGAVVAGDGTAQFDCHRDYTMRYRRVHIHLRLGMRATKTEEWYWLREGEVWDADAMNAAGIEDADAVRTVVRVCAIDAATDTATVAVAATATAVADACALTTRPRVPPRPATPPPPARPPGASPTPPTPPVSPPTRPPAHPPTTPPRLPPPAHLPRWNVVRVVRAYSSDLRLFDGARFTRFADRVLASYRHVVARVAASSDGVLEGTSRVLGENGSVDNDDDAPVASSSSNESSTTATVACASPVHLETELVLRGLVSDNDVDALRGAVADDHDDAGSIDGVLVCDASVVSVVADSREGSVMPNGRSPSASPATTSSERETSTTTTTVVTVVVMVVVVVVALCILVAIGLLLVCKIASSTSTRAQTHQSTRSVSFTKLKP